MAAPIPRPWPHYVHAHPFRERLANGIPLSARLRPSASALGAPAVGGARNLQLRSGFRLEALRAQVVGVGLAGLGFSISCSGMLTSSELALTSSSVVVSGCRFDPSRNHHLFMAHSNCCCVVFVAGTNRRLRLEHRWSKRWISAR